MTLSDLSKIFDDKKRCAVSLQQLSFFFKIVLNICVDCAAEVAFDKNDICDRIVKHGGCLLDNFDLAAVRPKLLC